MKQAFSLLWGLPHDGGRLKSATLRPLTIGAELRALEAYEDFAEAHKPGKTESGVAMTLAYWTQQLSVDGLPPSVMSIAWLMDNLVGEDYRIILDESETLRAKSAAASDNPQQPAEAAEPNPTTTGTPPAPAAA
ncbi:hypothetical protein [Bergeriella denitrificans]|uniref:Uncharacterized protein n=1 Tax=Bergeriella denitrificans TaxID=494 RepID=A0A378UG24_BERDE|nr:hypothetical protein [Bergeriella denitrificans]STZ76338.1 Uncharacterised protein [Bergeriella denitrificans]